MIINVRLVDYVSIQDTLNSSTKGAILRDTLSIQDNYRVGIIRVSLVDAIIFSEAYTTRALFNISLNDALSFIENYVPRALVVSFSDQILLIDEFRFNEAKIQFDSLNLIESYTAVATRSINDQLSFLEFYVLTENRTRTLNDALPLDDFYKILLTRRNAYIRRPEFVPPTSFVYFQTLDLLFTLEIIAPKFGNMYTSNYDRINRVTPSNELIISGIARKRTDRLMKIEWDTLKDTEVAQLKNFLNDHVGKPFIYTHMDDRKFKFVHLKPEAEISQIGINRYAVIIDMQEVS